MFFLNNLKIMGNGHPDPDTLCTEGECCQCCVEDKELSTDLGNTRVFAAKLLPIILWYDELMPVSKVDAIITTDITDGRQRQFVTRNLLGGGYGSINEVYFGTITYRAAVKRSIRLPKVFT
jgi:hypothetical protein